ncbi:MAG: hypothetical protein Fur0010_04580 [Bdellovibrio sp.]
MKILTFFLFLFYQTSLAASFKIFPEGEYKSLSKDCEDRILRYIGLDEGDILFFGQDVSIQITGPLQTIEKVPQGCSYKFNFTRNEQVIERMETRSQCPNPNENGTLSVRLEKSKDKTIHLTKRSVASDGKTQEEKCSFKKQ